MKVSTPTLASTPEAYEQRMKDAGYFPAMVRADDRCPRRLVDRRHEGDRCWCRTHSNDHGGTFMTRDANEGVRTVVVWQPYGTWAAELEDVLAHARLDGLAVSISGASPYNPGSTFLLVFSPARES
jgi:hypothetical protein